jgi:hypothetical protein
MAYHELNEKQILNLLKEELNDSANPNIMTNVIRVVNKELPLWEVDYNALKRLQKIVAKKLAEYED